MVGRRQRGCSYGEAGSRVGPIFLLSIHFNPSSHPIFVNAPDNYYSLLLCFFLWPYSGIFVPGR